MSCAIDKLWKPGRTESSRDTVVKADGTPDTGLDVRLYVLPAIDSPLTEAVSEFPLTETVVDTSGIYEGPLSHTQLAEDLTVATTYYVVTADEANGYVSDAKVVHYGYFLPELVPE